MKATINKNDILPVLSKIQGLAGRKTNLAITTNILIQTEESGISIAATDLETGFEGFYPAKIEDQGAIAINARKLYEIVRDFPSEDIYSISFIYISSLGKSLTISYSFLALIAMAP
jgi:DNA polymerase-3 subunit beta